MTNETKFAVTDEDGYIVRVWNDKDLAEREADELDRLADESLASRGITWGAPPRHGVHEVTGTTVRGESFFEDRTRPLRVSSRPGWDNAWKEAA